MNEISNDRKNLVLWVGSTISSCTFAFLLLAVLGTLSPGVLADDESTTGESPRPTAETLAKPETIQPGVVPSPSVPVARPRPRPVENLLFLSTRKVNENGITVDSSVIGDLDADTAQRAGRPWSYLDERKLFRTEAWSYSDDGLTTEYGYRVIEVDNPSPIELSGTSHDAPEVDPELLDELDHGDPTAILPLQIDVRGVADWNIPLRPTHFALSARDAQDAEDERKEALDERRAVAKRLIEPIERAIVELGGEVVAEGLLSGWISARVPASSVAVLMERTDLKRMGLLKGQVTSHAQWRLDDVRSDSYIDARQFLDRGYTGEQSNPTRHGFGDITIGIIESGQLENEACFLYDGADCSGASRLQELFRCDDWDRDGNYCEPVSDFHDNDESASHGTFVASVILGDYSQGQADPYQVGDSGWTPGGPHSATFVSEHGGMAPEARLIFFGQVADNDPDDGTVTSAGFADAFDDAIDRSLDITNSSWGWNSDGSTSCDLRAVGPHEQELENAFDDGIFNVVSAGNPNTPFCAGDMPTRCSSDNDCMTLGLGTCDSSGACTGDPGTTCDENSDCSAVGGPCTVQSGACNIGSPADIPKSFAVNGLNGKESNCELAYGNCTTDPDYSANGGITATVNGVTCPGCLSGIDITAPTRICGTTSANGLHGTGNNCFNGTSASAPVVTGAAALVKDQYLASGQTWINNPGMLHTVMLAMGDRNTHNWGSTSTTQSTIGSSDLMGMGRLKLRLFENGAGMGPWGNNVTSASFVSGSSDVVYQPFEKPMPAGTQLAKCVLYQVEDMSDKDDISRVDLEMRLRDPVSGTCPADPIGTLRYTQINSGTEIKKMTALTSSVTTLEGRCVHVTMDVEHITSKGLTSIVNCYYSGVEDEFSAPD